MPDLTVAMFTEVVETTCRLVDAVTADQWSEPSQPAPETASGIDRLAALLGRKVP